MRSFPTVRIAVLWVPLCLGLIGGCSRTDPDSITDATVVEEVEEQEALTTNCPDCPSGSGCVEGLCVCTPKCDDRECGNDGCGGSCGTCYDLPNSVCTPGGKCTCTPTCQDRECGTDGCQGDCGMCPSSHEGCEEGRCVCRDSCAGKQCGHNLCGDYCGKCEVGHECVDNQCYCVPDCQGRNCGDDHCGGSCGECTDHFPNGQCEDFECVCIPETCETAQKECGYVPDGCGGVLECGDCHEFLNSYCDAKNVCQCAQTCEGRECGDDGCGGSCGSCDTEGWWCQLHRCAPEGMVKVPAGTFHMGCNPDIEQECDAWYGWNPLGECEDWVVYCGSDEYPLHEVYLPDYYIDRTEVSITQYKECFDAGMCPMASFLEPDYEYDETGQRPAHGISWFDAVAYCEWRGRRLCTEAEWEKAARGPNNYQWPWGNLWVSCIQAMYKPCWYCTMLSPYYYCDLVPTVDVDSFEHAASGYGALNMAGNVEEWVSDWYDSGYYEVSPGESPEGPETGSVKVVRGGHWDYSAVVLRSANRISREPTNGHHAGIRCCKSF